MSEQFVLDMPIERAAGVGAGIGNLTDLVLFLRYFSAMLSLFSYIIATRRDATDKATGPVAYQGECRTGVELFVV